MKPQLKVLTGFSAGTVCVFSKQYIAIGRHPASDLKFDADKELDVSSRHAALLKQGERWLLRDLGSRNGTLVNGHKISADTRLDDTDQVRLGANGPNVEFRLVADSTPDTVSAPRPTPESAPLRPSVETSPGKSVATAERPGRATVGGSTTQRIRAEVQRQTKGLRTLTTALGGVLVMVIAAFVLVNRRQEQLREQEAQAMQARIDSVLAASEAAVQSLKGQVAGLGDALQES